MNPYDILQLPTNATEEEIKQKFRSLAQQYHPDKGGDPEKFKQINLAYSILSDPIRRKYYDDTGSYEFDLNIKEEALNTICARLNVFLWRMNVDSEDLIFLLKSDFSEEKRKIEFNKQNVTQTISNFERAVNKMKKKKDGENILKHFIQIQINEQKNLLKNLEHKIELCSVIIEILDDYEYGDRQLQNLMEEFLNATSNQGV